MKRNWLLYVLLILSSGCFFPPPVEEDSMAKDSVAVDTFHAPERKTDSTIVVPYKGQPIATGSIKPEELIRYAKTLIGTKYQYGSTDPAVGFDCSGFITYVFNHFKIAVPRSSIDFTNVGTAVDTTAARTGDLILFRGTNPEEREVGHMGIISEVNNGQILFIHSTSGKEYGVTITPFNAYYKERFVSIRRIFP